MNFVVVGSTLQRQEFALRFPALITQSHGDRNSIVWVGGEIVFDFTLADDPDGIAYYADMSVGALFYHAVYVQLAAVLVQHPEITCPVFGFNGLPGLFQRPVLELSSPRADHTEKLVKVMTVLGAPYELIEDRVGMVTPRILAMIINEAYYTLQEGTAMQPDIDLSMRLGTSYPLGPFEWAQRLGLKQVYTLLELMYQDTHDERYKICPLLRTEYYRTVLASR
jgi:3-hydroxybutyryl-CoA dehydrogenase